MEIYCRSVLWTRNNQKESLFDESSTEESESQCVHININKEKDANNEAEYEEP